MKIINKLEILAILTAICLTFGYQPAHSVNRAVNASESSHNQESQEKPAEFVQASSLLPSSKTVIQVNDSLISLPIPQPLAILCVLGMAGFSGFLKLKIAQVKYQEKETEEPQIPELVKH